MEAIPNEFDLDSLLRHWLIHEPRQVQPTEAEARALPALGMLRLVTGVMWALGRFLTNVDTDDGLYVFLSERALAFDTWTSRHGDELVERATRWIARTN